MVPVGPAKFDLNRCNESPLRGEKPDFWPVSKFNTGSLPLRVILPVKKHHIFAATAAEHCAIFPKLCIVIRARTDYPKVSFCQRPTRYHRVVLYDAKIKITGHN